MRGRPAADNAWMSDEPLGAIYDTNSDGRYDLVVYGDGILGIRGSYLGVALRGGGAGLGGFGAAATGIGAAAGASEGQRYEARHAARLLVNGRDELLARDNRAFFMERPAMTRLRLRKRWYEHRLTVEFASRETRTFTWKPALNRWGSVEQLLAGTFGSLVGLD
jgi:hypothetical protein